MPLIVVVVILAALFLVIISLFISCFCLPRCRRRRAFSVRGEFDDVDRPRSVRRVSDSAPPAPWLMPRPTALRWFPEYAPAPRTASYLPPAWQQVPFTSDESAAHDVPDYTDDLQRIVSSARCRRRIHASIIFILCKLLLIHVVLLRSSFLTLASSLPESVM